MPSFVTKLRNWSRHQSLYDSIVKRIRGNVKGKIRYDSRTGALKSSCEDRSRTKITFTMICLKSHKERAASGAVLRVTCGLHSVFAVLPASYAPLHLWLFFVAPTLAALCKTYVKLILGQFRNVNSSQTGLSGRAVPRRDGCPVRRSKLWCSFRSRCKELLRISPGKC